MVYLQNPQFNDTHPTNPLTRITGALAAGIPALYVAGRLRRPAHPQLEGNVSTEQDVRAVWRA